MSERGIGAVCGVPTPAFGGSTPPGADTPPRRRVPTSYLWNWDRLRVVAALDIVAMHLTGGHALFGFGLPMFLLLSVALSVSKPDAPDTGLFVRKRARHILLPWLFWAVVLTLVVAGTAVSDGNAAFGWAEWPMLLYGPRIHLWFLPFVVVAGLGAHLFHRWSAGTPTLSAAGVALAVGLALLALPPRVFFVWPFDQWFFSLPSVFLGYALGRAVAYERNLKRLRRTVVVGYALFAVGCAALALADESTGPYLLRFAGGLGLLVAALWLPNRADGLTKHLTPLMLGVYILHPVVWQLAVGPALGAFDLDGVRWLRVLITFPLTIALVFALKHTWLKRVL